MPRLSPGGPTKLLLCSWALWHLSPTPKPMLVSFPQTSPAACQLHKARHQVLGHLGEEVALAQLQVLQLLAAQDTCQEDHRPSRRARQELSPCRGGGVGDKTLHSALLTKCLGQVLGQVRAQEDQG